MPVRLPLSEFNKIVRTAKTVREVDDWKITVQPDSFHLETCSEDRTFSIHHVLPASLFIDYHIENVSSPSWINIDPRNTGRRKLFPKPTSDEVRLTLPDEREDTRVVLQSGNRRFRFSPIKPDFYLQDFTGEEIATVSLRFDLVTKAVQAADLVGDVMRISVDPDVPRIEFSAQKDDESFSYTLPAEKIGLASGDPIDLEIPIEILPEILNTIRDPAAVSLVFAQYYLKIDITGHISEGKMSINIAKRQKPY